MTLLINYFFIVYSDGLVCLLGDISNIFLLRVRELFLELFNSIFGYILLETRLKSYSDDLSSLLEPKLYHFKPF